MAEDLLGGRYRILSPLGAGGMGEVFLAEDTRLERRVAVKFLPASAEEDAVARERLRREALAAAALDHPFICKVYEIGDAGDRAFIVMEYVEGDTLRVASRRGLPVSQVVDIAHQLTQALDAAHRRGVVHRDLKPANVMVTPQGHVKVMDFGLAKQVVSPTSPPSGAAGSDPGAETQEGRPATTARAALTDAGTRLGTPAYMSPEQILGASLDPRSDLFSLGVILHELATGRHPFLRDNPAETMAAILRDQPTPGSRDADEVTGFGAVIHRLLSKACAERHQTTTDLLDDLEALRAQVWSSSRTTVAATAPPAERTPFVGRDAEAADLTALLDRMLTGKGGLVLVGGEPGVGKTRLARELMAVARQRGCLCLTGQCYEMEGAAPLVPFVETTEQVVRLLPQAARAAMGNVAAEIAAMVPSLRRTYNDIPPLPEVPADQLRRLIFSAFLEYLRRGVQKSPVVHPPGRPALGRRGDASAPAVPCAAAGVHAASRRRHVSRRGTGREAPVCQDPRIPVAPAPRDARRAPPAERVERARSAGEDERVGAALRPDEGRVPRNRGQSVLRRGGLPAPVRGREDLRRDRCLEGGPAGGHDRGARRGAPGNRTSTRPARGAGAQGPDRGSRRRQDVSTRRAAGLRGPVGRSGARRD